ncbi:MAG: serine hydrolase domain-containing protein [Sphingomonadaceae bacterium]
MKLSAAVLATILCLSPLAAIAQSPDPITASIPEIDQGFADFMRDAHVPGLVYGIVANGRLVHVKSMGVQDIVEKRPVTRDTLFRIASMSKAFTALAILKLRDDGKLALDDLAEKYVPEMRRWTYPTSDAPRIRIRDLLSHVAGFVTDDPWGDRQQPLPEAEFTKMLATGVPWSSTPETGYEYSNFGYALLGRIVTNVSGSNFKDYIEPKILKPLGMTASGYEVKDAPLASRAIGYRFEDGVWKEEPTMKHGAFGSMGGLQTSANDYARYVAWLLQAWPARDGAEVGPLRRSSIRELAQGTNFLRSAKRRGKSGATACQLPTAYGKGMIVAQDCNLGLTLAHGGGFPGYGSHVMLMPEYGVGIFVFANRTYAGPAGAARDGAMALLKSGALKRATPGVSAMLAKGYAKAGAIYSAGSLQGGGLAMNFLMDRDAAHWMGDIAKLKTSVGSCATDAMISPTGALSGTFMWTCEKGKISGDILLAPTPSVQIQALRFSTAP